MPDTYAAATSLLFVAGVHPGVKDMASVDFREQRDGGMCDRNLNIDETEIYETNLLSILE